MKKNIIPIALLALVIFSSRAFATGNPFADVPDGHWSYDAVAFLASHGIVSGYPDGNYRGKSLATRYEMASIIARAMTKIDIEKAPEEDVALLKKLVAEYGPELDALGVKVANLSDRTTALENGLRNLHLLGYIYYDAEWRGSDINPTTPSFCNYTSRFLLEKQIDNDSFFCMGIYFLGVEDKMLSYMDQLWFSTLFPGGIRGRLGYQTSDWDREYKLYNEKYGGWGDEDAFWTDLVFVGLNLNKDFGKFDIDAYLGRNTLFIDVNTLGIWDAQAYMLYALKVGYKDKNLKLGIFGRYAKFDGEAKYCKCLDEANVANYGIYVNYAPWNGFEIKGTYNHQQFHGYEPRYKNADHWQITVELDQSLLKLFSLWLQYDRTAEAFLHNPFAFYEIGYQSIMRNFSDGTGVAMSDFSLFKAAIHRDITEKLKAFLMYERFDNTGNKDIDDTVNLAFGVAYMYAPSVIFQLQYDWRDYGQGKDNLISGEENIFRFRTLFYFY